MEYSAQELQDWSCGRWTRQPSAPVRGFAFDSRTIKEGELFICLTSERRDGHDFIPAAAAAGAAGALVRAPRADVGLPQLVVEDPLRALAAMAAAHRRRFAGPVIGITGSCGKTSTKDLLSLLLGGPLDVHATQGNFNNLIGVPITLLGLDPTVHRAAVIEAGINQPGEMAALAAMIQPTHSVVTLLAPAHLEQLGDLRGVAREKGELVKVVPHSGAVVAPASCLLYEPFHELAAPLFTAAEEGDESVSGASVRFRVEQQTSKTVLHIRRDDIRQIYTLRKVSAGMAANAVLAIEMATLLGVSDPEIQDRLMTWKPGQYRGEVVECGPTRFYVDCYNANPAAMEDSLALFQDLAADAERRLYVLGCMAELGTESVHFHRDLGRRVKLGAGDRMFITGGDEVEALREGLLAAGNQPEQIRTFSNIGEIAGEVAGFDGFVFIKGSRAYGLESLLARASELSAGKGSEC